MKSFRLLQVAATAAVLVQRESLIDISLITTNLLFQSTTTLNPVTSTQTHKL